MVVLDSKKLLETVLRHEALDLSAFFTHTAVPAKAAAHREALSEG
jgi:hypothetical protein